VFDERERSGSEAGSGSTGTNHDASQAVTPGDTHDTDETHETAHETSAGEDH